MMLRQRRLPHEFDLSRTYLALGQEGLNYFLLLLPFSSRYRTMKLPPGLSHSLCLSVTALLMASVLDSPMPSVVQRRDREMIPFVVAVDRDAVVTVRAADSETVMIPSFSGRFNVVVESLVDELFLVTGIAATDPLALGRTLQGGDVWVSGGRFGVHRASS